jgi:hypothetical protein
MSRSKRLSKKLLQRAILAEAMLVYRECNDSMGCKTFIMDLSTVPQRIKYVFLREPYTFLSELMHQCGKLEEATNGN